MLIRLLKKKVQWLAKHSWIVGLVLFIAAPVTWAAIYALAFSLGGVGRLSTGWTVEYWQRSISEGFLTNSIVHSLYISGVVTSLVIVGAICSSALLSELRHSRLLSAILLTQSATPAVVVATQTNHWVGPGGVLSRLAFHCGWIESPNAFPAIVQDPWSIGVIVAITLTLLPLAILYFMNLWDTIGMDRYCQLAEQLGCTPWQTKIKIAIPMLLRRGNALSILVFLLAIGSYEIPLLLDRQTPQMFSVATQRRSEQFNLMNRPESFALATVYFALCTALLFLYIRQRSVRDER
jgi:putative spermidine/putrescine transport system permease protein